MWFDADEARRRLAFFELHLKHIEGALSDQPFALEPWQRAIIAHLFGWKMKDSQGRDVRRYREALIYIPRKNGKTPLGAGIGLSVAFQDGMRGAQIYCAAADRDQAALLFRHAKGMVELNGELGAHCKIYRAHKSIEMTNGTYYRVLSAEADTKHGFNIDAVLIDELHAQPNRALVDTLRTGTASANKPQTLTVYLTTADFKRESICNEIYDYACKVRDGILQNAQFLPVIFEAPAGAAVDDEAAWAVANPNLGVSVSVDYMRAEAKRAKDEPSFENTFRRLHLNQRTESDVRWLSMDKWDACDAIATPEELIGQPCYGGVDLGATSDLTTLCLAWPPFGDRREWALHWVTWCPAESARERDRLKRLDYLKWAQAGHLILTDGNEIDYARLRQEMVDIFTLYGVRKIAADRLFQGAQLCQDLGREGLDVDPWGMGYLSMNAPTKEFERLVNRREVIHNGNPIARWCAANTSVEMDAAGNIKPSKGKSTEKIDLIVAAIMAIGVGMVEGLPKGSIYETRGILAI